MLEEVADELGISKRNELLVSGRFEFSEEAIEKIKSARDYLNMARMIHPAFEDPYYKGLKAATFLYISGIEGSWNQEAEELIALLDVMKCTQSGALFSMRDYYEAIGDIQMAKEINDKLVSTSGNDVKRMEGLYLNYLKNM